MEIPLSYLQHTGELLRQIEATQAEPIARAADMLYDSLSAGGVWHIFGTGHSHMAAEELYYRAGGLAPVNAILFPALMQHEGPASSTKLERLPGLARIILEREDLRPGEIMTIVSNSGKNAVPLEMALLAKERCLKTIALTSFTQSRAASLGTGQTQKLYEVCDIVIDNCGTEGDAAMEVAWASSPRRADSGPTEDPLLDRSAGEDTPAPLRVAGTSSVANLAILEEIVYRTCQRYAANGLEPPVFKSANLPGGDEWNARLIERYKGRVNLR